MQDLKNKLDEDLDRECISSTILLNGLSVITEDSRKTSSYVDPRFVPFYYYLGKYIQPKNMAEIGFGLGFLSTCFLKSCRTVENFFGFREQTDEFYNPRFGLRNIRSVYRGASDVFYGDMNDPRFQAGIESCQWDLVLLNEEKNYDKHMLYLDSVWSCLRLDGYIVMDYINSHEHAKKAFYNFCKIQNREPMVFETRYGVGIIQK